MSTLDKIPVHLLTNAAMFEEIHQAKSAFVMLYSALANELSPEGLSEVHPASQGYKISKGNELQRCPYQVLDIIRDFDPDFGFNIRLLNWWGRGMYIFLFFGRINRRIFSSPNLVDDLLKQEYFLARTSSPWDYTSIIDLGETSPIRQGSEVEGHIRKFGHLQLVKKIDYTRDFPSLKQRLREQVLIILNLYNK